MLEDVNRFVKNGNSYILKKKLLLTTMTKWTVSYLKSGFWIANANKFGDCNITTYYVLKNYQQENGQLETKERVSSKIEFTNDRLKKEFHAEVAH